jgi:hypothetical protein
MASSGGIRILASASPKPPLLRYFMREVTLLLAKAHAGDPTAAADLLPLVYGELGKLAAAKLLREAPGHTLQPTALVHEAWRRLGAERQALALISPPRRPRLDCDALPRKGSHAAL